MSAGHIPLQRPGPPTSCPDFELDDMETAKVSLSPHQQKCSKQKEVLSYNSWSPRSFHKRSVCVCCVCVRVCVCSLFTMVHLQTWKALPSFFHVQKHTLTVDFLQEESESKAGSPPHAGVLSLTRGGRNPCAVNTAGSAGPGHGNLQGSLRVSARTTWPQSHEPRVNSSSRLCVGRGGSASFYFHK